MVERGMLIPMLNLVTALFCLVPQRGYGRAGKLDVIGRFHRRQPHCTFCVPRFRLRGYLPRTLSAEASAPQAML